MFVQVSEQLIDEVSVVLITNVGTKMGEIVSDYSGALSDSRARVVWFESALSKWSAYTRPLRGIACMTRMWHATDSVPYDRASSQSPYLVPRNGLGGCGEGFHADCKAPYGG